MQMKKKGTKRIVVGLFVGGILISPILVALGITIPLPIIDNVNDASGWIAFWGAYIGAIITAVSAYGLWMVQRDFDKKQEVVPIINVCQINGVRPQEDADYYIDYLYLEQVLSGWKLCDPQHELIKQKVSRANEWFHTCIMVESIGKGAVMNLQIDIMGIEYIKAFDQFAICLKEGEVARYDIYIEAENLQKAPQKNELFFRFKDVYNNEYIQSIKFGIHDANERNGMPKEYAGAVNWQLTYFDPISSLKEK